MYAIVQFITVLYDVDELKMHELALDVSTQYLFTKVV